MEILGNYDTKTNQLVLTPKQLNLVCYLLTENIFETPTNLPRIEDSLTVPQGLMATTNG